MDIGEVLSRSWQIIWKHKVLWIFGILASCSRGGSGGGGSSFNYQTDASVEAERFFNQISDAELALLIIGFFIVVLILVALVVFLGTIGRIGLIRGAQQADGGQEKLTFGELFSGSTPYFWRVFLLNLIVAIGTVVVFIGTFIAIVIGGILSLGIGLLCLIPLCCLMIPAAWVIQVLTTQSSIAIVVEDLSIMDGLRRGWQVMRENAGPIVLMWLILVFGLTLIVGTLIALPFIFTMAPFILGLISGGDRAIGAGLAVTLLCCAVYLPFLILLSGVLNSYVETAWTLTFLRLTNKPDELASGLDEPLPEAV